MIRLSFTQAHRKLTNACGPCSVDTRWTRTLIAVCWLWLAVCVINGCGAIKSVRKHGQPPVDPYVPNQFTPENTAIGWIWPSSTTCSGPVPYVPREGDIIFTSSISPKQTLEYLAIARIGLPHHILLVFKKSNGCLATFEVGSGGDRSVAVRSIPTRLNKHKEIQRGSTIAIRQIRRPLTYEESFRLTCFAESQVGKPFSAKTTFLPVAIPGRPVAESHDSQASWYCSEIVAQALRNAGLLVGANRPKALVPEDLYLDERYDLGFLWTSPQEWTPDQNREHPRPLFAAELP